jgi:broad specificity phosphatase PhoE
LNQTRYLLLARHAESEANRNLQKTPCGLYYSMCGSDPEVPLTDYGHTQADELGRRIARLFPAHFKLHRIFENGFLRVRQTTDGILKNIPYDIPRASSPLLEKRQYGKFWNLTRRGVRRLYPDEWLRYQREGDLFYRAPGGGENYPDLFGRVDRFIDEHVEKASGNTLVITSSVVKLSFRRRFEGLSDAEVLRLYEQAAVPNADILIYRRVAEGTWMLCDSPATGSLGVNYEQCEPRTASGTSEAAGGREAVCDE